MNNLATDNTTLAEQLRNDDPEQFYTLVRMHLSFVLDLNTDECDANSEKKFRPSKWNLPFSRRPKGYSKTCTEGSQLTTEVMSQMQQLIKFLSQDDNISQEGIFRRSGKMTRQQELKTLLGQGVIVDLNDSQFSVHDCASVLKNMLSELPESILTDAHYPAYCQIAELCGIKSSGNEERLLRSIQLLILLLPTENRNFFQEIIALLHLAASHQDTNRMSPDNLATLFTPHLLCPRKLSPEALHTNSQVMSRVVAFMIEKGAEIFEIPNTLATDVRAYWNKKEKRKLSPLKQMNESVCDGTAANTVFSFVDRERTAQENGANPTETALAQLYAYIQSLPESSKKRKLIKQFNKENGHGTPLRANCGKKRTRSRSLGDSIKKHLPVFNKTVKRAVQQDPMGEQESNSPMPRHVYSSSKKLFGNGLEETRVIQKENVPILKPPLLSDKPLVLHHKKKSLSGADSPFVSSENNAIENLRKSFKNSSRSKSCEALENGIGSSNETEASYDASDDSKSSQEVVQIIPKRTSSPPIDSISPCKSPRLSFVKASTNQDKLQDWPVSNVNEDVSNLYDLLTNHSDRDLFNHLKTPGRTLPLRHKNPDGYENLLKTPLHKLSNTSNLMRSSNVDCFLSSPNNTNRLPIRLGPKSQLIMTTSTPAPSSGCLLTPVVDKNNSMSPITRSTQRMPKSMQETMMTPRSRKPVISLSGTDLCHLASVDSWGSHLQEDETPNCKSKRQNDFGKKLILEDSNEGTASDSLSSTFRDYLFSRSVLTASPVDLSFSSRTDDFLSISDKNSSAENDDFKSLPESILNEAGLSESLLYCLDGNEPPSNENSNAEDPDKVLSCSCSSFNGCTEHVSHVYETAL